MSKRYKHRCVHLAEGRLPLHSTLQTRLTRTRRATSGTTTCSCARSARGSYVAGWGATMASRWEGTGDRRSTHRATHGAGAQGADGEEE